MSELIAAVVGAVVGIVVTLLTNKAAARLDRKRRREELLESILVAADRANAEPLSMDLLYDLARLNVLGTHDLSADLRSKVDGLIRATRRYAQTNHVSNRLEEGGADDTRRQKALDDFGAADVALSAARAALIAAGPKELGRET